jgi:hypothetical protein
VIRLARRVVFRAHAAQVGAPAQALRAFVDAVRGHVHALRRGDAAAATHRRRRAR